MTATVLSVGSALSGQAVDGLPFTWAYASDQASPTAGWPALVGGVPAQLTQSGRIFFGQETPGLDARGAGSGRVNSAVVGEGGAWTSGAAYPNPGSGPLYIRLVFRATRMVGAETYFELGQAAQRITIQRSGSTLRLVAQMGGYVETIDLAPFINQYVLLDVWVDFAGGKFHAYLNGIDYTPAFPGRGSALTAFGGVATLSLMDDNGLSNPCFAAELVFAGVQSAAPVPAIAQHRSDADALAVLADGLSVEGLGGFTWAWAPNRVDLTTPPLVSLPGEPLFGDISARLFVAGAVAFGLPTGPVLPEGLRRPRIDHAFGPTLSTDSVARGSPSGFPSVNADFQVRVVFKVASSAAATQNLVFVEDSNPLFVFGIAVSAGGDLILTAMSGYTETLAGAITLDQWHLLDVTLVRDSGGVAQLQALLDGASVAVPPFGSLVSDIPAGAQITFFDNKAALGAATATELAFVGLTIGSAMTAIRHILDSVALGVHS